MRNLAPWSIGNNLYTEKDLHNNFLKIQILNNKCYTSGAEILSNGKFEQRQFSICRMIENLCTFYKLPDVVFSYCTHDRTPDNQGGFFTHARIRGEKTRNVLAPCFTFFGYPEVVSEVIKTYKTSFYELLPSNLSWSEKEDSVTFVGTLTERNFRTVNSNISVDEVKTKLVNQSADSSSFISRRDLEVYKYLLHLNGNEGAYASRLKYLLGINSVVFYNYNSGPENNFWEEWWMKGDYFINGQHFVAAKDIFELHEKIKFYNHNPEKAKQIAKNGTDFFRKNLNPNMVDNYWVNLLHCYKAACNFSISSPIGKQFNSRDYQEV
jgi:hypothetical protein